MKSANLILKCFRSKSWTFLLNLFKTFVRSKLEFSSPVWNPQNIGDIDLLERVQRTFTRRVCRNDTLSYAQRLQLLKLDSLELRRLIADQILVFKLLNKKLDVDWQQFFILKSDTVRVNRGHDMQIYKPRIKSKIEASFFSHRVIDIWNSLPQEVIHSPTVASFRYKLAKMDFSRFLKGNALRD